MAGTFKHIIRELFGVPLTRDKKTLRSFGFVMAGAAALVAVWFWWQKEPFWPLTFGYALTVSLSFLLLSVIFPILLSPLEWIWMRLAHVLGFIMTRVILTITYVLVIVPTGLVFRLLGKDLLDRKLDRDATSYWVDAEEDGPWTRHEKPY